MSQNGPRQPPRFVPTLTDVVSERATLAGLDVPPTPAFIGNFREAEGSDHLQATPQPVMEQASPEDALPDGAALAQAVQTRVLDRVSENLEERLRYALGEVVQLHTQSLYQALRDDVERLVSSAVHEAVAQELAQMRKSKDV